MIKRLVNKIKLGKAITNPIKDIRLTISNLPKLFFITFKEWNLKDPFRQSAVIAYYAIFSIPGLLVLIITITGYFFGKEAVSQNIISEVATTMGADTAAQVKVIFEIASKSKSTIFASIIGIFIMLIGATGVFVELQKTLNIIWLVKVVPKKGILPILKTRLFSFGLILVIAFLLLISLVISTALSVLSDWIRADVTESQVLIFKALNFIFSLAVISFLFALIYKVLPDAKIKWKHVWLGALVAGTLFTIGKFALAYYFGKANPASVYGAAGSIILILLWVSYSSMILFFGAEFTAAYTNMFSSKVPPSDIAVAETTVQATKKL
jgi:membrane protein